MPRATETSRRQDPVCGMDLTGLADTPSVEIRGEPVYFCSRQCAERFSKNPERFRGAPLIELKDVRKTFTLGTVKIEVLRGLDARIWKGDFVVVIGASGSGKSTALNMIGLLDRPTSGQILFEGKDVSGLSDNERAEKRAKTFGFVFQQYNLMPWLTAYENVTLPLLFTGGGAEEGAWEQKFSEVGLGERMTHRPLQLSGGEQQRVALLRALANDPPILLCDEPTGNLDSATGNKILDLLIGLNREYGKTLVVVTHDADIAGRADQIIALKDGRSIRDHVIQKKLYTE